MTLNGGVIDGNGNTLSTTDANATWDSVIYTTGGTIKNLTVTGGFRGILIVNPTEDIILDNVNIGGAGVGYAINTGEGDSTKTLTVTNSTIAGWTSFAQIKSASFTNCKFVPGSYHGPEDVIENRIIRPYVTTVFKNCEFDEWSFLDLCKLLPGCTITLDQCTVNDVVITAANYMTLFEEYDGIFGIDPGVRELADCVIFK